MKKGGRFVVTRDFVTPGFLGVRATVLRVQEDGVIEFKADRPIENWNMGDLFNLFPEDTFADLVDEEIYDSPLYQALL